MRLVDEADALTAKPGARRIVELRGGEPVDDDLTLVRPLQQTRNVKERRFAGARGRDQCHHLARAQDEIGSREDVQALIALRIVTLDAFEPQRHALAIGRLVARSRTRRRGAGLDIERCLSHDATVPLFERT